MFVWIMWLNVNECELFHYFHAHQFNLVCLVLTFRIGSNVTNVYYYIFGEQFPLV